MGAVVIQAVDVVSSDKTTQQPYFVRYKGVVGKHGGLESGISIVEAEKQRAVAYSIKSCEISDFSTNIN